MIIKKESRQWIAHDHMYVFDNFFNFFRYYIKTKTIGLRWYVYLRKMVSTYEKLYELSIE